MPLTMLTLLALLLPQPLACPNDGPLVVFVDQMRTITVRAEAESRRVIEEEIHEATAPDFGPFSVDLTATATQGTASASFDAHHRSSLFDSGLTFDGEAVGMATLTDGADSGSAGSTAEVCLSFELAEEANYTAQGFIHAVDNSLGTLFLGGPQGTLISEFACCAGDLRTVDQAGVLAPGTYGLSLFMNAGATAGDATAEFGRLEYALHVSLTPTDPEPEIGTRFCSPAVPNSTGGGGVMTVRGSSLVSDDCLVLEASGLPAGPNIGYFIMGTGTNTFTPPGSIGPVCVAPGIKRYLPPVNNTTQLQGGFARYVGTSGPISGQITAGSTWNFQAWHRDAMGGTSNLTDGISVSFQ